MRKPLVFTALVSLLVGLFAGLLLSLHFSPSANANGEQTIHVVEHAITDTVVDIGPKGDSLGDVLAFANPVFDADNEHQVGSDNGHCIRTVVGKAWECFWTIFLSAGQITVEGPFFDTADSTLAITGGTGSYVEARGQMTLHARGNPVGSEFDFIYHLVE